MKYPQLVHMPRDVEHWLEKQLEARGIDGIVCAKHILDLLAQVNTSPSMECISCGPRSYDNYENKKCFQVNCNRQSWDVDSLSRLGVFHYPMSALKEKCDIEKLVDELCVKLREIENNGTALFDVSTDLENNYSRTDASVIYPDAMLSGNVINMGDTQTFPPCDSIWTRGLLHDSEPVKDQNKMEDYFSALFYENPSDNFGFEFTRFKSDERQDGKELERINFYNKQNLLASESTERLYERNTDVDKLIAKFDSNIEGIWKPPDESEDLGNFKYETPHVENTTNPCIHGGSDLIWSFDQNGNDMENNMKTVKENIQQYKPNFSSWSKLPSPIFASNLGLTAMLNSMNMSLASVQKWSSIDGQNVESNNICLNHNSHESGFTEVVPKSNYFGGNQNLRPIHHERNKGNGDEEDLLTSAKTHFRPIRMEEVQASQPVAYEDGTTFAISNEFEKVTFTRSNSGILYLDTDSEFETPRKYMEYKEREITNKLFESGSDLSLMEEFIPKFRVRQSNEKCCQTEDVVEDEQIVPSYNETDCESDSYECEGDDFFFPGDSELAENITNKMDDEGKHEFRNMKSDCNYNDIYVTDGTELLQKINASQCVCGGESAWLPSNEYEMRHEWSDIWCQEKADEGCKYSGVGLPTKEEYFRFREELTQEGEQLLSDLSCLQLLYSNSKWGDGESISESDFIEEENQNECFLSTKGAFDKLKGTVEETAFDNLWLGKCDMSKSTMGESAVKIESKLMKSNEKNLSSKLNEIRERPFKMDKPQKEKKRRNSATQKIYNHYAEGQNHRALYRFSFCDQTNPQINHPDAARANEGYHEIFKSLKRPLSF